MKLVSVKIISIVYHIKLKVEFNDDLVLTRESSPS